MAHQDADEALNTNSIHVGSHVVIALYVVVGFFEAQIADLFGFVNFPNFLNP